MMKGITRERLLDIVHSERDSRYEYEVYKYLDIVHKFILNNALTITRKHIPDPGEEKPQEKEILDNLEFQHDADMSRKIARVLWNKYQHLLKKGYYFVTGRFYDGAAYAGGIADIVLRSKDRVLIAVEVGEVRADKPLEAFFRSKLEELWVYPYRGGRYFYVFERGPRFKELEQYHLQREKELNEELEKTNGSGQDYPNHR